MSISNISDGRYSLYVHTIRKINESFFKKKLDRRECCVYLVVKFNANTNTEAARKIQGRTRMAHIRTPEKKLPINCDCGDKKGRAPREEPTQGRREAPRLRPLSGQVETGRNTELKISSDNDCKRLGSEMNRQPLRGGSIMTLTVDLSY
jgi:hypothetical protein